MQRNVAPWDRAVRAVAGLGLLAVALAWGAPLRWLPGVVGVVFLVTAAAGYCPLYGACRISTLPRAADRPRA